ncbi:hypothetical protein [Geosporobacter ferrireducens]|uniref:Uncharacterized protein n=1 Tax=Geosporobacter ferrireducens TaxID=1424294 RepID=A0A1D8GJC7_9FIRM|nr:hypothetical protein [Geosporobacter ferrireducens]AOT71016.1 hypothetical protein Gferi_16455 [Geosporobacter ferrireducens]MTI53735.1 hypothetical protein [Geosporobacter ferrireducens]
MNEKMKLFGKRNFDYEEDDYDRLKNINQRSQKMNVFTNKVTRKKIEFDYEEDVYEPEKGK